jgi:hypothetical protein
MTQRKNSPRFANAEASRLEYFIYSKYKQGIISQKHVQLLRKVSDDYIRQQGYFDEEEFNKFLYEKRLPAAGVIWHEIHLVKSKLIELYPQLEGEVNNLFSNRDRSR